MTRTENKIDNLLCYLFSARGDISNDALIDSIFTFYSADEIKNSKATLVSALNKHIPTRNNPDKKSKDLNDLLGFVNDWSDDMRIRFVSDNYKKMPPNGIEVLAPMLIDINEQLMKLNEVLPQFVDLKSEVLNSADTVRNLAREISNIKGILQQRPPPLSGHPMQQNMPPRPHIISMREPAKSYGMAVKNTNFNKQPVSSEPNNNTKNQPKFNKQPVTIGSKNNTAQDQSKVNDLCDIPIQTSQRQQAKIDFYSNDNLQNLDSGPSTASDSLNNPDAYRPQVQDIGPDTEDEEDDGWNMVRRKSFTRKPRVRKTGAQDDNEAEFSAATDYHLDVFLSRVGLRETEDKIRKHVTKYFNVNILNFIQLDIQSTSYKAFKFTVLSHDREKLLDPTKLNLWPRGVIVDKFYTRSRSQF